MAQQNSTPAQETTRISCRHAKPECSTCPYILSGNCPYCR